MKTAKELLELRNKLKEEKRVDRMAESEWKHIEGIIDQFEVIDNSTYIEVPKVRYTSNKIKLGELGFLIYNFHKVSRLYFDKDEYEIYLSKEKHIKINSVNVKSDSEKCPWQEGAFILKRDSNSPHITVKWKDNKGDYNRILDEIKQYFNTH